VDKINKSILTKDAFVLFRDSLDSSAQIVVNILRVPVVVDVKAVAVEVDIERVPVVNSPFFRLWPLPLNCFWGCILSDSNLAKKQNICPRRKARSF
jgi:hypothetical protein